ncbi:MAG: hypothetical protein WDA15_01645 [Trueperaceae bacterium]
MRVKRTRRHLALTLALSVATLGPGLLGAPQLARAHATLVIGDLQLSPDPPVPGEAVSVRISLVDPLLVAVEKALVRVEFREIDPEDPFVPASITGSEAREFLELPSVLATEYLPEVADGVYAGTFTAPEEGRYTVSVRDTTFRDEEAIANIGVDIGRGANNDIAFVLPPTPIGPRSLGTWLLWIIGIPLVAGLLVTFLALRKPAEAEAVDAGSEAPEPEPPTGII